MMSNPILEAGRAENGARSLAFAQYVAALITVKGRPSEAVTLFQSRHPNSRYLDAIKQVPKNIIHKASIDPASTVNSAALIDLGMLASGFIAYMRPLTVIGRMSGFRAMPLNVRAPRATTGTAVGWVGQGRPVAVTRMSLDTVTFTSAKIAGIAVTTKELAVAGTLDAEMLIRQDLTDSVAAFQDTAFLDPSLAAVSDVSPASITYGATEIVSTGSGAAAVEADFKLLFAAITTNKTNLFLIMHVDTALFLAALRTTNGTRVFPDVGANGGSIMGVPVIVTTAMPADGNSPGDKIVVAVDASEILLNEGSIGLKVSTEASLQMDSAPTHPADATAIMVSLFQQNLAAIMVERFVNWQRRRDGAVAVLSGLTI